MAKVITQGVVRKTHKECGSVIEFELRELKTDYSTDYTGGIDYYRYLVCPACEKRMYFSQHGNLN